MSESIKLSPKHGLNPTIPICFFCGEPRNEVALLGKMPARKEQVRTSYGTKDVVKDPDPEAPMHSVIDFEPCDECKAKFAQGYTALGVSSVPVIQNQPPVQDGRYLTGDYLVLSEQGVRHIFSPEAVETILGSPKHTFLLDQEAIVGLRDAAKDQTGQGGES